MNKNAFQILKPEYFASLPCLMSLTMRKNLIPTIEAHDFSALSELNHLDLSSNKLSLIRIDEFAGNLRCLKILKMIKNRITSIEPHALEHLQNLEEL